MVTVMTPTDKKTATTKAAGQSLYARLLSTLAATAAVLAGAQTVQAQPTNVTINKIGEVVESGNVADPANRSVVFENETISWTIELDKDNTTDPQTGLTVQDVIGSGQTLVPGSLQFPENVTFDGTDTFTLDALFSDRKFLLGDIDIGPAPAPVSFSGGGDGWAPVLWDRPDGSTEYILINHHLSPAVIQCIDLSTGTTCGGASYPVTPQVNGETLESPIDPEAVLIESRLFFPVTLNTSGQVGIFCWDLDTDSNCAGPLEFLHVGDDRNIAGSYSFAMETSPPVLSGTNVYAISDLAQLYCMDGVTGGFCGSNTSYMIKDFSVGAGAVPPNTTHQYGGNFNGESADGRVYFGFNSEVGTYHICYDEALGDTCADGFWPTSEPGGETYTFPFLAYDSSGTATHICSDSSNSNGTGVNFCTDFSDGSTSPVASVLGSDFTDVFTSRVGILYTGEEVYVPDLNRTYFPVFFQSNGGTAVCWDWNTGGFCSDGEWANTGGIATVGGRPQDYGIGRSDNLNCNFVAGNTNQLWSFADDGGVDCNSYSFSAEGSEDASAFFCGSGTAAGTDSWETVSILPANGQSDAAFVSAFSRLVVKTYGDPAMTTHLATFDMRANNLHAAYAPHQQYRIHDYPVVYWQMEAEITDPQNNPLADQNNLPEMRLGFKAEKPTELCLQTTVDAGAGGCAAANPISNQATAYHGGSTVASALTTFDGFDTEASCTAFVLGNRIYDASLGAETDTNNGLQNVSVGLFEDTNGNGTYESNLDVQVGSSVLTDANGNYSFTTQPGNYFIVVDTATLPVEIDENSIADVQYVPHSQYDDTVFSYPDYDFGFAVEEQNLTVTKVADQVQVSEGNPLTYTISVAADNPNVDLTSVVVNDSFASAAHAAGMTLVSASPAAEFDAASGNWTILAFDASAGATLVLEYTVGDIGSSAGVDMVNNAVYVSSAPNDSSGAHSAHVNSTTDGSATVRVYDPGVVPDLSCDGSQMRKVRLDWDTAGWTAGNTQTFTINKTDIMVQFTPYPSVYSKSPISDGAEATTYEGGNTLSAGALNGLDIEIHFFETGTLFPQAVNGVSFSVNHLDKDSGAGVADTIQVNGALGGVGVQADGLVANTAGIVITSPTTAVANDPAADDNWMSANWSGTTNVDQINMEIRGDQVLMSLSDLSFCEPADPIIGLAKNVQSGPTPVAITDEGREAMDYVFEFTVENFGNVPMDNVVITDDFSDFIGSGRDGLGHVEILGYNILTTGFTAGATGIVDATTAPAGTWDIVTAGSFGDPLVPSNNMHRFEVTVRYHSDFEIESRVNSAVASADYTDTQGTNTVSPTDVSVPGLDADPGNDGLPEESGPTTVLIHDSPMIGLAVEMTMLTDGYDLVTGADDITTTNGDWEVEIAYTIENSGNTTLTDVTLMEDLTSLFGTPGVDWSIVDLSSDLPSLVVNPDFDSVTEPDLFVTADPSDATDQGAFIDPDTTGTVILSLILHNLSDVSSVQSPAVPGDYNGNWEVNAESVFGQAVSDQSVAGTDPDGTGTAADQNDTPADEQGTTTMLIGNLGLAKEITDSRIQPDEATFQVDYRIVYRNTGAYDLEALTLTEDLEANLGAAFLEVIGGAGGVSITASDVSVNAPAVNPNFDGTSANSQLFDVSLSSLPVNTELVIEFTIHLDPDVDAGTAPDILANQVIGTAFNGTTGITYHDWSDSGSSPVTDNGTGGEDDTTDFRYGGLGVAKAVTKFDSLGDGRFLVEFAVKVKNIGGGLLTGLSLDDDVHAQLCATTCAFGTEGAFESVETAPAFITAPTNGDSEITLNAGWMAAAGNSDLLAGANSLAQDDEFEITYKIIVNRDRTGAPSALTNSVTATATDDLGRPVEDQSDEGTDPNGTNGNASPDDATRLPLTPTGKVYNSVSRNGVAGVAIQLTNAATGDPLPAACLRGNQQPQVTDYDGGYFVDLTFDLPECPASGTEVGIELLPNGTSYVAAGYQAFSAGVPPGSRAPYATNGGVTPPESGAFDARNCADGDASTTETGCQVVAFSDPPSGAQPTTYYLSLNVAEGGGSTAGFNHIALDHLPTGNIILTTKEALEPNAQVGDVVTWIIKGRNSLPTEALQDAYLVDLLPPGFTYRPGTSRVIIQDDSDAVVSDVIGDPDEQNGLSLRWNDLDIPEGGHITVTLRTVVGSGVPLGIQYNRVQFFNEEDQILSFEARGPVEINPEPVFDCGGVIGRVFDDKNADGYADKGERGIPGVRMVTVDGLAVKTDGFGRFHLSCAMIPDDKRGSNFIMKLDTRTLPTGFEVTSENPRVVRLTRGKMTKLNFAATSVRTIRLELTDAAFDPFDGKLRPRWQRALTSLAATAAQEPSMLKVSYLTVAGDAGAEARLVAVTEMLAEQLKARRADVTIQRELIIRR